LVEAKLLTEMKSVERTAPVHGKQVLTYLRLMDLPLGAADEFRRGDLQGGPVRINRWAWLVLAAGVVLISTAQISSVT
jgi:hypothetical protein